MNTPEGFQVAEGYASYRPAGKVSLEQAISLGKQAILFARHNHIGKLLLDTTQLNGFGSIGTLERFRIGEQMAMAGNASITVAMVVKAELIDPLHFGVMVARNRGLRSEVFPSEAEALAWLLDPNAK